jgi:hypothetical protein
MGIAYIYKYSKLNNFVNIEFHDLKMCANWSAPFNYVSSNLSDLKNKYEIFMDT